MKRHRILFAGPVGAGKSTAIRTLAEGPIVQSEVSSPDALHAGKLTTTVALDYATMQFGDVGVMLYGTPGQPRFSHMWPIVARYALGAIVLANNESADPIGETLFYVRAFAPLVPVDNCVVGITRSDSGRGPTVDDYSRALEAAGLPIPALPVDVRRRDSALLLIELMIARLEALGDA